MRSRAASASPDSLAVLFLDLDDFKTINDSLGHRAGDALLQGVAARIDPLLRPTDTAARLGGDEFAVLLDGVDGTHAGAGDRRSASLDALREPFTIDDRELNVTASVGIALSDGSVAGRRTAAQRRYRDVRRQGRRQELRPRVRAERCTAARSSASSCAASSSERWSSARSSSSTTSRSSRSSNAAHRRRRGAGALAAIRRAGGSAPISSSRWPRRPG